MAQTIDEEKTYSVLLEKLRKQLKATREENENLRRRNRHLLERQGSLAVELKTLNEKFLEMHTKITQEQLNEKSSINTKDIDESRTVEDALYTISELKNKNEKLNESLHNKENQLTKAETNIIKLKQQQDELTQTEAHNTVKEDTIRKLIEGIKQLKNTINTKQQIIESKEKELEKYRKTQEHNNTNIANLKRKNRIQTDEIRRRDTILTNQVYDHEALLGRIRKLEKEAKEQEHYKFLAEETLGEIRESLASARQDLENSAKVLINSKKELERLNEEKKGLILELKEKEEHIQKYANVTRGEVEIINELRARIKENENELISLQKEVDNHKREMNEEKTTKEKNKEYVNILEQKIKLLYSLQKDILIDHHESRQRLQNLMQQLNTANMKIAEYEKKIYKDNREEEEERLRQVIEKHTKREIDLGSELSRLKEELGKREEDLHKEKEKQERYLEIVAELEQKIKEIKNFKI